MAYKKWRLVYNTALYVLYIPAYNMNVYANKHYTRFIIYYVNRQTSVGNKNTHRNVRHNNNIIQYYV